MDLAPWQWAAGLAAAFLIGFSKTGLPGVGILGVPLMALAFGGRLSVGALLPILILADVFAVSWYRRTADWSELRRLVPWVLTGMALGTGALIFLNQRPHAKDPMNALIGGLVLLMLVVAVWRKRRGEAARVQGAGVALTGIGAGFSTLVSNAAGPIMGIYLTSLGLNKDRFMGTTAWYFLIFNLTKLPVYFALTEYIPNAPMLTTATWQFDLAAAPVVILGAFVGRWFLGRVPQQWFDDAILALAGAAAVWLILQ